MPGTLHCNRAIRAAILKQEEREFQGCYEKLSLGRRYIVNLGPANSLAVFPGKASYTTAKHAIVGITKTGAIDYTARGIRVNSVFPIWVSGPMNQYEASVNLHLDKIVQAVVPLKRIAQLDEVADAIVFLCSPAASFITGASMLIDTGAGLTVRLF